MDPFVLMFMILCGLTQINFGLTVRCETDNTSSCYQSSSCLTNHPLPQQVEQCHRNYVYNNEPAMYGSYNVTECPANGHHCDAYVNHNENTALYFKIRSVSSMLYSLDPLYFSMNVRWNYTDVQRAINQPVYPLRGYELRVQQNDSVLKCLCIWEPHLFNISLGTKFRFRSFSSMTIKILTLPLGRNLRESYFTTHNSSDWPSTCNTRGLVHDLSNCPINIYSSPRNVQSYSRFSSDGTKALQISWNHPETSLPPPLDVSYYVNVAGEHDNFTFVVNGTQSVTINDLESSQNYSVQVQVYSPCSGYSSFSSSSTGLIGCGMLSGPVSETPIITTSSVISTTQSEPLPTSSMATASAILGVFIAVPLILSMLLLFLLSAVIILILYKRKEKQLPFYAKIFPNFFLDKSQLDVLVVYSLNTPEAEQCDIEKFVVGRLKQRGFSVRSCNDHTEKTIMQWLEEQARIAHSVFIVCNKSFFKEWNAQNRTQLINSLKTIIDSAVSQGSIEKFAMILLEKGHTQYIPDNLYLRGTMKFVMGEKSKLLDMDKIIKFIKIDSSRKYKSISI